MLAYQAKRVELLLVALAALRGVVCHEEYPGIVRRGREDVRNRGRRRGEMRTVNQTVCVSESHDRETHSGQ